MRKLILLLFLVSTQVNSEMISTDGAEWKFIGNNAHGDNFYDINSIKRNDSGVINYISKSNTFIGDSNTSNSVKMNGVWVMSVLTESKFDCNVPNFEYVINANLFKKRDLVEPFDKQAQLKVKEFWEKDPRVPISSGSPFGDLHVELCKTITAHIPASKKTHKVSIDDAKKQCEDIGFKVKTEKFGECVMDLMK